MCKECGHPLVLCRDPEYDGWWEAKGDVFCYATAAVEQWRRSKPKDWEPEPGQLLRSELDPGALPAAVSEDQQPRA